MSNKARVLKERMLSLYGENKPLTTVPAGVPFARCENGTFVGKQQGDVSVFRGIPFAAPPTGSRRWHAPAPVTPSDGIFEALYNGKTPIQTEWPTEVASYYPQGEDCLYLNLWTDHTNTTRRKPVMVFFHGGSYGWGGTADPLYDGYSMVASHSDLILVTVGYRTGLMGFVDFSSLPGGEAFPDAPNLGLLDQIEALRWVQRNISSFGGDPENVTIFGESAGGGSVSLLPIIPTARGLFHRVIAQSGSVALTYSREDCADFTELLVKASHCHTMAELMALSEEELKVINESVNYYNNFPQRDGVLIPLDPYAPYLEGKTRDLDMIIGTNAEEANYWVGEVGGIIAYRFSIPIKFENDLNRLDAANRQRVQRFLRESRFRGRHKIWRMSDFYTETMFRLPAIRQAEGHADNGGRVYMYYWAKPSNVRYMGSCHAVELAYVFGNLNETIYTGIPADPMLSRQAQDLWINFARTGRPELPELTWPAYDTRDRQTLKFEEKPSVVSDILGDQRELLSPLLYAWVNPSYAHLHYNVPFVRKLVAGAAVVILLLLWMLLT